MTADSDPVFELVNAQQDLADARTSVAALTKLVEAEREKSGILVLMLKRAAREMPRTAGKDLLDDLDRLLKPS